MTLKTIALMIVMIFLASCGLRHKILGTDYGWNDPGIQILLDASTDKLRVRHVRRPSSACRTGFVDHLEIVGEIGLDSTAALERLLPQLDPCKSASGQWVANDVFLDSWGGSLSDGYKLGKLFRKYQVQTVITGGQLCASACAIAFLGGKFRSMEYDAKLLFHAPYTVTGTTIACTDRSQVWELNQYYQNMLGTKDGKYLLEKTLSYCSVSSGWTINADAAKLFGITNN